MGLDLVKRRLYRVGSWDAETHWQGRAETKKSALAFLVQVAHHNWSKNIYTPVQPCHKLSSGSCEDWLGNSGMPERTILSLFECTQSTICFSCLLSLDTVVTLSLRPLTQAFSSQNSNKILSCLHSSVYYLDKKEMKLFSWNCGMLYIIAV